MALINCPECGRMVSDKAVACPQCGCPIAAAQQPPVTRMEDLPPMNEPGQFDPQQVQFDPQQVQPDPQQVQPDSQQGQFDPRQGQPDPQQGQFEPRQGEFEPRQPQQTPPPDPAVSFLSGQNPVQKSSAGGIKKYLPLIIGLAAALVLVVIIGAIVLRKGPTCAASGCSNTPVKGGRYCSKHTCAKDGCYNYVSADDFYCYQHDTSYSSSSSSYSSYESASVVLRISDVKVETNSVHTKVTGKITNNGKKTYKFVQVKGAFKNSSGTVLDTDWTYAVGSEGLAPGESSTFTMYVDQNYSIKSCTVTLLDYDTD